MTLKAKITELEAMVAKLQKLLAVAKLENSAIREVYELEQQEDKSKFDKQIKAMFDVGYQQALADFEEAEREFITGTDESVHESAKQRILKKSAKQTKH